MAWTASAAWPCGHRERDCRERIGRPTMRVDYHYSNCGRVSTLKRNAQGPTKHNHAASRREALRCRTTSNDRTFPSPTPHHAHTAPPHVLDIREGCPPRAASRSRASLALSPNRVATPRRRAAARLCLGVAIGEVGLGLLHRGGLVAALLRDALEAHRLVALHAGRRLAFAHLSAHTLRLSRKSFPATTTLFLENFLEISTHTHSKKFRTAHTGCEFFLMWGLFQKSQYLSWCLTQQT